STAGERPARQPARAACATRDRLNRTVIESSRASSGLLGHALCRDDARARRAARYPSAPLPGLLGLWQCIEHGVEDHLGILRADLAGPRRLLDGNVEDLDDSFRSRNRRIRICALLLGNLLLWRALG